MDKDQALSNGENALTNLPEVSSTSYEGGDGDEDTEWHSDYRVWPAANHTKHDVANACEDHYGEGYILSVSMTNDKHDFVYVTVRTV